MNITTFDFKNIPQFSDTDKAYTLGDKNLRPFYKYDVTLEAFEDVIKNKKFEAEQRNVLVKELEMQYEDVEASEATLQNIQRLKAANCYTVVTAHQPNLFTGPLYSIYKIISTINLAEKLAKKYPKQQFVPIFWTGGEDHDFEEVNHLNLFGNRLIWEDEQGGPVGKYSVDSLRTVLDQTKEILGDGAYAKEVANKLEAFYGNATQYSEAVKHFLNWIFGAYGLVIVNANTAGFKRQMIPLFKDELLHQPSKPIIEQTIQDLEAAGYQQQAYAREINLFYLSPNKRSRIVKQGDSYEVLDTDIRFSEAEILKTLKEHPENFSPNVVLRPLFQESILPNLAYIGGGGEIAYWLERKTQFEHYQVPFPMLIRRCSVLWIPKGMTKLMSKLNIQVEQLFEDTHHLLKQYVLDHTEEELSLQEELESLNKVFECILTKAKRVDPALEPGVLGQQVQMQKAVENLEQRLIRAEKKKNETSMQRIQKLKDNLFPKNGLQERYDNFLAFYSRYGRTFLDTLKANLDVLDKKFVVIED
ncbi:bacillithiol biosynthesis cysteine-adding enzyme BshC [Aureispira sp. CCB-QB1]|uniref:bacillithiol biosynthesis cysteine-adding enzyme BshC n=1 Tax=Aureispira sp. CCB-QB1 TaxID=1313421 RepID=UPI000697EAFF|nr:bacillithiol biosynthesis cysteine-adding enzyme BshC [Aureispira sp. CCB-QB1]